MYLMANRHYSGYDRQEEIAAYPTREAAEQRATELMDSSYVHDEGEVLRATYVVVKDWIGDQDESQRTGEAADGDGTQVVAAGNKPRKNSRAKR